MPLRTASLITALALLWGAGFLWIKLALDGFSPVQLTFARLALGAVVLAAVVAVRRLRWPRGRAMWGHLTVAALISNALPYGLFAYAEQTVPSSVAGSLNATTPLWTAVIAYSTGTDRPMTARRVAGLLIGLVGAVAVLSPWNVTDAGTLGGLLACLAAAASYGLSYVYQARYLTNRGTPPLVLAAAQLAAATVLLALLLPAAGRQPIHLTAAALAAVLILGVLGTGLAYVINFALITTEGATAASVVTYLVPTVSVALGLAVLGEPTCWGLLVGLVLVLLAIAMTRNGHIPRGPQSGRASITSPRTDS